MPLLSNTADRPVLVVGRGLIGGAVADRLRAEGRAVVTVATSPSPHPDHLRCDLNTVSGRAELKALVTGLRPERAVLTHGPSDVTWIEGNEREAEATHHGVAAMFARLRVPTVFVSTDNVFDGTQGFRRPQDDISPHNAYGRLKAKAEWEMLNGPNLVLRVSLVYGWTGSGHRTTYGQRCIEAAVTGRTLAAPTDQSFTPVHVRDVADVITALCQADELPTGIAHLAGPEQLSRFDFAVTAYRLAGTDPGMVRPCLRADTEWASRPRYSSLACDDFRYLPGLEKWSPMSPHAALWSMVRAMPRHEVAA